MPEEEEVAKGMTVLPVKSLFFTKVSTGHARETMQREYERLLRELNRLYTMNHAVKKYREAQHDRT